MMPDATDRALEDLAALEAHVRATQGDAAWETAAKYLGTVPRRKRQVPERVGTKPLKPAPLPKLPASGVSWRETEGAASVDLRPLPHLIRLDVCARGRECGSCGMPIIRGDEMGQVQATRLRTEWWDYPCLRKLPR